MSLRTTDLRRFGWLAKVKQVNSSGAVIRDSAIFSYNVKTTDGFHKYIDGSTEGSFVPGILRVNPVTIYTCMGSQNGGYVTNNPIAGVTTTISGDWNMPGNQYPRLIPSSGWRTDLATVSHLKTLSKLKDAELDLAVMLGELGETLAMLKNPLKSLTGELSKLYRHGLKKVNKKLSLADALTGSWLTYRYGIIPFLSDCQAIVAAYQAKFTELQGLSRIKARVRTRSENYGNQTPYTSYGITWTTRFSKQEEWQSTTHEYYERQLIAERVFWLKLLGLTPGHIPAAMWEWATLSFVVDWVIGIGDWLRALTPTTGVKHLANCTSQKYTARYTVENVSVYSSSGIKELQPAVYTCEIAQLMRVVNSTVPVFPALNPNILNFKRVLDSISLIWSFGSKDLKRMNYALKR